MGWTVRRVSEALASDGAALRAPKVGSFFRKDRYLLSRIACQAATALGLIRSFQLCACSCWLARQQLASSSSFADSHLFLHCLRQLFNKV